MRLRQVHRAGPFAGNHLRQIGGFQRFRAVLFQRLDGAHGECRTKREGHGAGVPHLHGGDMQHVRQVLAAEFFWSRQPVPAASDPIVIEVTPAIRRLDLSFDQTRALTVADVAEGRHLLRRESARFRQDGIDQIFAEVAERTRLQRVAHACHVFQRKRDLVDGCLVHDDPPR
ncbi:hypothetical protein D9M70_573800 [compost metagenome]